MPQKVKLHIREGDPLLPCEPRTSLFQAYAPRSAFGLSLSLATYRKITKYVFYSFQFPSADKNAFWYASNITITNGSFCVCFVFVSFKCYNPKITFGHNQLSNARHTRGLYMLYGQYFKMLMPYLRSACHQPVFFAYCVPSSAYYILSSPSSPEHCVPNCCGGDNPNN